MVDMEAVRSHSNGFFRSRWVWPIIIVIVLLVGLLVAWLWSVCSSCVGLARPSALMAAECRRQLDAYAFELPHDTAHERYLIDTPPRSAVGKSEIKFYVAIKKNRLDDDGSISTESIDIEVHRPDDVAHLYNKSVGSCY
jgi:hypothetical protein